jgi:hypothetical protein
MHLNEFKRLEAKTKKKQELELVVILLGEFSSYGDKKIGKFFILYCKFKKNWKILTNFQNHKMKRKNLLIISF